MNKSLTVNEILDYINNEGILLKDSSSLNDYVEDLSKLIGKVAELLFGEEQAEKEDIHSIISRMNALANDKGLSGNYVIAKAIKALEVVNQKYCISSSGTYAEKKVEECLQSIKGSYKKVYRNIYLADESKNTEIDDVVITNRGIFILEVKKVSKDVNITDDGRMFVGGESYGIVPLYEKMKIKRNLFQKSLRNKLQEKNLDIYIYLDSYIVFVPPKKKTIKINDRNHSEKWCCIDKINSHINSFFNAVPYNKEQLDALDSILSEMQTNRNSYASNEDFDKIKREIAEGLSLLLDEPESSNPLSEGPLTECKAVTKSNNIQSKIALVSSAIGLTVASGLAYVFAKRRKHY